MAADWLKDVGAAFEKIGHGAKELADDLRKAVGIGVGDVHLELERHDFAPGDRIRGTLSLALTEETPGKRVVVALRGTRRKVTYDKRPDGRRTQSTHTETVYELERELAGEGTYRGGQYPFELVVPKDATSPRPEIKAEGWIGDVARVVSSLASASRSAITWRVVGAIEIPWRRNVTARVDISVS